MSDYAPPTRIRFISHPATAALREGRVPGDEPLDDHAIKDLERVRWRPSGSYRIWASSELRTMQTASALGLKAVAVPELRECGFGGWRERSLEEIYGDDPDGFGLWLRDLGAAPHMGESFEGLLARVGEWLDQQRDAGPCVVFTHASVIRAAVVHALSAPQEAFLRIEVPPLSVTDLRVSGGQWHVRSLGAALASEEEEVGAS